ncbi:MAG: hypothetical protein WC683_13135 [bacterium]
MLYPQSERQWYLSYLTFQKGDEVREHESSTSLGAALNIMREEARGFRLVECEGEKEAYLRRIIADEVARGTQLYL